MEYRPLFVLGIARSGTNLLARMFHRHPDVAIALDPLLPVFRSLRNAVVAATAPKDVLERFSSDAPFQDYYFSPDGPLLLDLMLEANADLRLPFPELESLREKASARGALESESVGALMRGLQGDTYKEVLQSSLDIVAGTKPNARWIGTKELWVAEFVPLLARLFPDAHFLLIERDPRAIVASLLAMAERDSTQAAHAPSYMRHWRKQVALARRFESDCELRDRFHRVAYEKLVTSPEEEARRLCDVLQIDFNPDMQHLSSDGWKGNSSYEHNSKDVYAGTLDRWRQRLPTRIVESTDFLCGLEMELTTYRPMTEPEPTQVLAYLQEAGQQPGSWRSDSGDLLADFGGELVRYALLSANGDLEESLVRRCFLFSDIFSSLRQCGA